ncbi:MAG TPA: diacylglycerol kinase family protein [Anaerolineales bacterium]|nr:diacylglycerol kinase family protein [Anaerolineales bacterium]
MPAKVILNPYANRWKALERKAELEAALRGAGVEFELAITERPRHGEELAEQAALEGYSPIVSAGGDGSINEILNGIGRGAALTGKPWVPMGVMPLGSANDFVDNLSLPRDLPGAAQVIAAGYTRAMDVCTANGRFFGNNAAIGLEPFITLIQQEIHWLKGTPRYLLATLMGVQRNPQWQMQLEWDGGSYTGRTTLVTVGNNPRTGGLFYMTPHADPFDGKLTFVYAYMRTRSEILKLLPRTMKPGPGSYVEHPAVHEVHTTWLKVHSIEPTPAHTDGEIFDVQAHAIDYQIIPGCLPVLLSPPGTPGV